MSPDAKSHLHRSLRSARDTLRWKLDGLSEYDLRRPLTPTGTNLLGIVKHLAYIELGYFGDTFGRPSDALPEIDFDAPATDPNADLYATADETVDDVFGWFEAATAHADATIDELALDAPGVVPWWGDRGNVTLHQILVHLVAEEHRHLGQVDILREHLDGSAGLRDGMSNMDDDLDWAGHVAALERIAAARR